MNLILIDMNVQLFLAFPFVLLLFTYLFAGILSSKKHKPWPLRRYFFWFCGIAFLAITMIGPLAQEAHHNFSAHMIAHILLGMLAPLLLALAAPVTLILRTVQVSIARQISKLLRRKLFRLITDPTFATFLNVGGLWVLYTTDLYLIMQQNFVVHLFVNIHVFFAGYLFTTSIIYIDPTSHRRGFIYRSIVLVIALAGHGILAKYIFANPPVGVSQEQAEIGAMLMYYGGDAVDAILIFILCFQWFQFTRPRSKVALVS
ncbi:hypothetical protein J416_01844 [Gracilibacillus halophilus YIM-C55.5]|uniref:Cytochrome c oxidase assembly protein n=1 Tax=Gracilibacillus halophilus YIM-C55.5 TaxID=1308866 RepID=N4WPZ2_9BACI|nr:cytochrome c oxidase assembly protein [Gracilibacillus halophilus]ENH98197.1 hypothetical protein J416_01844 [Gracilibacillus halophilus YIM-C55.5]